MQDVCVVKQTERRQHVRVLRQADVCVMRACVAVDVRGWVDKEVCVV